MDRIEQITSCLYYIIDGLKNLRQIEASGSCNDCKNQDCGYKPEIGKLARYNCPFYKRGE